LILIRETISPSSPDSSKYNANNQWRLPTIFYNVAGYNPLWLMYERFSQDARRAVFFADREARQAGSPYLEPEHLLLGLTHEADSKANQLFALAAHAESFRKQLEAVAPLKASKPVDVPVSNTCQRVLVHTVEEADQLGSRQIGTEHLLLGLLRENESRAAELLASAGIHLHIARNRVRQDAGLPI
jgi:ATP-dependent Clp protease ATP-binding subunit ClpC